MEFHEKLQGLRKNKGMTQEELAEALYVSRTAISKWELGRGYPSLDSLKEISSFFGISIDNLLSADALLDLAEKDKKRNLKKVYDFVFAVVDLLTVLLIILPLYPKEISDYVYAVNLWDYGEFTTRPVVLYWIFFVTLFVLGVIKILRIRDSWEKTGTLQSAISMGFHIFLVMFLIISREPYAATLAFLLILMKGGLLLKGSLIK